MFDKKEKKTYQLHKLDAMSICMWTEQNTTWVFYYKETTELEGGALNGENMPFSIGTNQMANEDDVEPWSREWSCSRHNTWDE